MIVIPSKVWNLSFKLFFSPDVSCLVTFYCSETERNTWLDPLRWKTSCLFVPPRLSPDLSDISKAYIVSKDTSFPTAQKKKGRKWPSFGWHRIWSDVSLQLILCETQSVPSSSPLSSALCILPLSSLNGRPVICRSIRPIQRLSCTDLRPAGKGNCARCQQRCCICLGLGAPLQHFKKQVPY